MKNRYPLLAGRRILRKESLWDIRDCAYGGWQLYYMDHTDGLLKGCTISAQNGMLVIGRGILKFHGFIYLMREEERVAYQPENEWRILKGEFTEDGTNPDYSEYRVRFFLDTDMRLKENQIEMCRFYLREGAVLRDSYKDFSDMATEYDTVNLVHATVAGVGEQTLHPALLRQFGEELWNIKEKDQFDISICNLIWNTQGNLEHKVIAEYLWSKTKKDAAEFRGPDGSQKTYEYLCKILNRMGRLKKDRTGFKQIIVD